MKAKNNIEEIVYLPLGGAGEIGSNCYLYGFVVGDKKHWVMVDCGMGFGNVDETPGIDVLYPDLSFIKNQKDVLEAVFFTHSHEDHVGAVSHLCKEFKPNIYTHSFVASVIRRKLNDARINESRYKIHEVAPMQGVDLGFAEVFFLPVEHSVPCSHALVIKTPNGYIFHSGDFKLGADKEESFAKNLASVTGKSKNIFVVCDSTNVFEEGFAAPETNVVDGIRNVISACKGAVAMTCFSSNVERLHTIATAAHECGRNVVVVGRAIQNMLSIAIDEHKLMEFPPIHPEKMAKSFDPKDVCYLVTGSQGEIRAALSRIARNSHPSVRLIEGDTVVFSSKVIPGNERYVHNVWNNLALLGVNVVDSRHNLIHVTGHPNREDLGLLYKIISPKTLIPMHGENRHLLEHINYSKSCGIKNSLLVRNGDILKVYPGEPEFVGGFDARQVYVDGHLLSAGIGNIIADRSKMSVSGHVTVMLIVDADKDLVCDPEVITLGVPDSLIGSKKKVRDNLTQIIEDSFDHAFHNNPKCSINDIENSVSRAVSNFYQKSWGKKPIVSVRVVTVD